MLARWNPWQDLFDMQRETSELLRRAFSGYSPVAGAMDAQLGGSWIPAVDVLTRDGDLVVRAELPGIDPEKDVDISIDKDVLTIRGERRHENRDDEDGYVRFESRYGAFQRSVVLPEGVNLDDIKASYENGVLEVVVPKGAELTAPRRIPIGTEGKRKALTPTGAKKK